MATNIITAANSGGFILDTAANSIVYVAADGFVINIVAGSGTYDIAGKVLGSNAGFGMAANGGHNDIQVYGTGVVKGGVGMFVRGGFNSILNAGIISSLDPNGPPIGFSRAAVSLAGTANTLENHGIITGGTAIDDTALGAVESFFMLNAGTISGDFKGGAGAETITNSGQMTGVIDLSAGANTINNSGTISGTVFSTGSLNFNNTGGLVQGNVTAGAAADTVDNTGGRITGFVNLAGGNDTFTGADAIDNVVGGDGLDTIDLNGGNDIFYANGATAASDGNDVVDGGTGIDTYIARALGSTGITIDLLDSTASGASFGTDHILNFENAIGTANGDSIAGNNANNSLNGGGGGDVLNGLVGNDRIIGGLGADTIIGGAGQDILTGGAVTAGGDGARDTFLFQALSESGVGSGARDWITDFTEGVAATADRINLAAIDASTAVAGDQAFSWQAVAGAAFTGVAGQLHYAVITGNTYVYGDVNGDKVADFSIALSGVHALAATDFIL
jgi:RTX calcium-binding nonapeptide repeat (4 copies)